MKGRCRKLQKDDRRPRGRRGNLKSARLNQCYMLKFHCDGAASCSSEFIDLLTALNDCGRPWTCRLESHRWLLRYVARWPEIIVDVTDEAAVVTTAVSGQVAIISPSGSS